MIGRSWSSPQAATTICEVLEHRVRCSTQRDTQLHRIHNTERRHDIEDVTHREWAKRIYINRQYYKITTNSIRVFYAFSIGTLAVMVKREPLSLSLSLFVIIIAYPLRFLLCLTHLSYSYPFVRFVCSASLFYIQLSAPF